MKTEEIKLGSEFPAASRADWESLALKALGGAPLAKLTTRTSDGIEIQPLYLAEDWPSEGDPSGFPGLPPATRGSDATGAVAAGWGIEQLHTHPLPHKANEQVLGDLQRGATGIVLRFDQSFRAGMPTPLEGTDGVLVSDLDDLETTLEGVYLDLAPIRIKAGGQFMAAASMLAAIWKRRGVDPNQIRGTFGADPLGALSEDGSLPTDLQALIDGACALARHAGRAWPGVSTFEIDGSIYHAAGATEAHELGCILATGLAYLKAMSATGIEIDAACRQITFAMASDENFFGSVARIRALRTCWSRLARECGASEAGQEAHVRAVTSERMMTKRDPWVNLLRTTAACFAAGIAGAESVTVLPFNSAIGLPDDFGRRIARNIQVILQEESSLNRVIDPAGGSWYLERLTEDLAAAGWREFQAIEVEGGMGVAVAEGRVQKRIGASRATREKLIANRRNSITGVNEFPNLREEEVEIESVDESAVRNLRMRLTTPSTENPLSAETKARLATFDIGAWIEAAHQGATIADFSAVFEGQRFETQPLQKWRLAEGFEALRAASDAALGRDGRRPRIFLANMGRMAQHNARATYSINFFEAGGIETLTNEGFADAERAAAAFRSSGAALAVICGSDPQYADAAADFARAIKGTGVKRLYLAGRPGDLEPSLRDAGVDEFIYMGCDVLSTLRGALISLGTIEA